MNRERHQLHNQFFALAMLLFCISIAAAAETPEIPTAPYPALRFVALDASFEATWTAVGNVSSAPQRMIVARDKPFGVITFSEYLAPQFQVNSFRNLPAFFSIWRQPQTDLEIFLRSQFSAETRNELSSYDSKQYPSDDLVRKMTAELNRLLFTINIARVADSADVNDRAASNRLALEAAFPNQLVHSSPLNRPKSESTLLVTLYLHPVNPTKTMLFISAWIEGNSAMGSRDRQLLVEIEASLASEQRVPR